MSTNNNVFAFKVKAVHDELYKTRGFLLDLIGSLKQCLSEGDNANLTKEIGIYAAKASVFLQDSPFITGIRKICTGEISVEEAYSSAREYLYMLNQSIDCFDSAALYNLTHENDNSLQYQPSCTEKHSDHKCKCDGGCKCEETCESRCECGCE